MKPPPSEEFAQWAVAEPKINPQDQADKNWINTQYQRGKIRNSEPCVFREVQSFLTENRAKNKASAINIIGHDFALDTKSFESVVSKCFRANIPDNSVFLTPPEGGWINSLNLFDLLNDLVRATVTCGYFNESRQISEAVANIAREHDLEVVIKAQARDVGYYAYHVYVRVHLTLVNQQWEELEAKVQL
jgi:ppGpp synthetase/RelA/SpoT-type nucleotidyltranferase